MSKFKRAKREIIASAVRAIEYEKARASPRDSCRKGAGADLSSGLVGMPIQKDDEPHQNFAHARRPARFYL